MIPIAGGRGEGYPSEMVIIFREEAKAGPSGSAAIIPRPPPARGGRIATRVFSAIRSLNDSRHAESGGDGIGIGKIEEFPARGVN